MGGARCPLGSVRKSLYFLFSPQGGNLLTIIVHKHCCPATPLGSKGVLRFGTILNQIQKSLTKYAAGFGTIWTLPVDLPHVAKFGHLRPSDVIDHLS